MPEDTGPKAENARASYRGPIRAFPAYMFFSQDWRERIKAENPEAAFGDVGKLLGAKWKELDDEEKKPYVERALQDRAEKEKAKYERMDTTKNGSAAATEGSRDGKDEEEEVMLTSIIE